MYVDCKFIIIIIIISKIDTFLLIYENFFNADVDKTRESIKEMMKEEGEWNTDEFPDMKQGLLDQLNIKN